MQSAYRARYSQIRDVQDDFIRVSKIQGLLQQFKDSPQCRAYLQEVLQQLCLCAFRKDVFQHIKGLLKKDMVEKALAGEVALCMPSVKEALRPRYRSLNLASGKRLAVQSIEVLFVWLWGWKESHFKRKHWEDKPYRLLFQRSFEIIGLVHGKEAAREWRAKLRSSFIKSHWLLPYPQGDRFMKSTGKSSVYWWSSYHEGVHAYLESQGTATEVPASHIGHYPLDGWGLSRVPGKYMPYVVEPELHLASLSESGVYEEALRLSLEPPQAADLSTRAREVYCIPPSDLAQRRTTTQIEADLILSREKLAALYYPRKPRHLDPGSEGGQSEGEQSETESLGEALSDMEELIVCIQQQEEAIQEKERELEKAQAQRTQELVQEKKEACRRREEDKRREAMRKEEVRRDKAIQKEELRRREAIRKHEVKRNKAIEKEEYKRDVEIQREKYYRQKIARWNREALEKEHEKKLQRKEEDDRQRRKMEIFLRVTAARNKAELRFREERLAREREKERQWQLQDNLARHTRREKGRKVLRELAIIPGEYN
jgi:hypothetical protein